MYFSSSHDVPSCTSLVDISVANRVVSIVPKGRNNLEAKLFFLLIKDIDITKYIGKAL